MKPCHPTVGRHWLTGLEETRVNLKPLPHRIFELPIPLNGDSRVLTPTKVAYRELHI